MENDWTENLQGIPSDIFLQKPNDVFNCSVCHEVMNNPTQCKEGHSFCYSCIVKCLERKLKCPVCRCCLETSTLCINRSIAELIDQMEIKCASCMTNGGLSKRKRRRELDALTGQHPTVICEWTGKVQDWKKHKKKCAKAMVPCTNEGCELTMERHLLPQHLKECPKRMVLCLLCNGSFRQESHLCDLEPLLCPNHCDKSLTVLRGQMPDHLSVCPDQVVSCKYKLLGCDVSGRRKSIATHECDVNSHLSGLMTTVLDQQQTIAAHQQTISALYGGWVEYKDIVFRIDHFDSSEYRNCSSVQDIAGRSCSIAIVWDDDDDDENRSLYLSFSDDSDAVKAKWTCKLPSTIAGAEPLCCSCDEEEYDNGEEHGEEEFVHTDDIIRKYVQPDGSLEFIVSISVKLF